jgi:hypothetical protein
LLGERGRSVRVVAERDPEAVADRRVYTLDLMVVGHGEPHTAPMRASETDSVPRDADNELYDRGCDLVLAATAIRAAAVPPEAAPAAPALLGCIEAAMRELSVASAALQQTVLDVGAAPATDPRIARTQRGLANLDSALADAEAAAASARALVARALAAEGRRGGSRRG